MMSPQAFALVLFRVMAVYFIAQSSMAFSYSWWWAMSESVIPALLAFAVTIAGGVLLWFIAGPIAKLAAQGAGEVSGEALRWKQGEVLRVALIILGVWLVSSALPRAAVGLYEIMLLPRMDESPGGLWLKGSLHDLLQILVGMALLSGGAIWGRLFCKQRHSAAAR